MTQQIAAQFIEQKASDVLLAELEFWSERLALLRGDNLYDVSRLFFAGRGVNCVQEKLEASIPFGVSNEVNDKITLDIVENQILAPAGLKFIRVIMGRLICTDDHVVGALVNVKNNNTTATYDLLGGSKLVSYVTQQFKEIVKLDKVPFMTRLYLSGQGQIGTTMEPVAKRTRIADISAMYPYLAEDQLPAAFWDRFKASNSNVTLLIGPPGTGKSNFTLEMMHHRGFDDNVHMADEEGVLLSPGLSSYIRGLTGGSIFISEDADKLVMSRERENGNMAALLNTSNGIVSKDTKIIISTNLESLASVDKALTRAGRCFDILEFRHLTLDEAVHVREMMDLEPVEFPTTQKNFSLADALNWHEVRADRKRHQSTGFGGR